MKRLPDAQSPTLTRFHAARVSKLASFTILGFRVFKTNPGGSHGGAAGARSAN